MPIKRSAMLLIALAIGSVSLLVFSSDKIIPSSASKVKCCKQLKENELFSPWGIMSQSMLKTKA